MKVVSAELTAAIEAPDRVLAVDRLFVDWDRDGYGAAGSIDDLSGYATSVSTDGSLQGDYPDEVRIVQGTAARTMTVGLGGGNPADDSVGTVTYFSPVAPAGADVPLAGKQRRNRPVFHEVGFVTSAGPEYVRDFTGLTRGLPVGVGQRAVTLQAVDMRSAIRRQLNLPAVAASYNDGGTSLIQPGLESTWVASYVLARNGFYASPPPRAACRVWAPMHGSAQPVIHDALGGLIGAGYGPAVGSNVPCRFTSGPYVTALASGTAGGDDFAFTQARAEPGGTALFDAYGRSVGRIEAWVQIPTAAVGPSVVVLDVANDEGSLYVDTAPQQIEVWVGQTQIATVTGPAVTALFDGGWHFLGLWWDRIGGAWRVRVDATTFTGTTTALGTGGAPVAEDWDVYVSAASGAALAEVQVTAGGAGADPWLLDIPFTPSALIDRSDNQLVAVVPDTAAVDSWQVLKDLAVADRGTVYCTDGGVARFRTPSAATSAAAQATQVTVTSLDKVTDLAFDDSADRVRNVVTCPWTSVTVSLGGADYAYQASSVTVLPGGQTTTLMVDLRGPTIGSTLGIVVAANSKADGTGTNYGSSTVAFTSTTVGPVNITVTQLTASTAKIVLANHSIGAVFLVDTTGSSALALSGIYLSATAGGSPAVAQDQASIDKYGEQPITLPSSPWRQSLAWATGVAQQVLGDTADPPPVITNLEIIGDPRLEYWDRIRVQDSTGSRLDGTYWVRSIKTSRAGGRYLMTLAAVATRDVLLWDVGRWDEGVWG